MSFTEVLEKVYKSKNFSKTFKFTDGIKFFDDVREFRGFEKLIDEYELEHEGFDFSFIHLKKGIGQLIIEKRNGDVITHNFEL